MARPRREIGFGVLMLAYKIFSYGHQHIPPVTLLSILGQALLYLGILNPPWTTHDSCLSALKILYYQDYKCLILSTIEHLSDLHLYHNMISLLLKGRSLENRLGSRKFFILLLVLMASSSTMYVAIMKTLADFFKDQTYMTQCAVGFSGVLFALKVLTTYNDRYSFRYVYGFPVPTQYSVWIELLVIQILVPNSSFIGHLAGILVGVLYTFGPLKYIVDIIDGIFNIFNPPSYQHGPSYTYAHGTTRSAYSSNQQTNSQPTYGWNTAPPSDWGEPHIPENVDINYEELRQRRLNRFN